MGLGESTFLPRCPQEAHPQGRPSLPLGHRAMEQGGFWFNQETNFKKSGSLIISYLVAFITAYYWKGSSYQGAAGNKSLETCKEAADRMGQPLTRRAGDWVPDSGNLGKIPKRLGLNFPPWKIRGIH